MNLVIFVAKVNRYKVYCVLSCLMIAQIFKDNIKRRGNKLSEFACLNQNFQTCIAMILLFWLKENMAI